jgi:putative pyruvate formate lyase activating enzyme
MLSPFSILKKENSKFRTLDIWKQLKDGGDDLPWYLAVSTNRMPAKYLISKSVLCDITDLTAATEERVAIMTPIYCVSFVRA